jgi:hypothetical protein
MNHTRLRQYETVMRQEQAEALVAAVRAAPAHRQADELTRRMQACDAPTRRTVFSLLTEGEVELLTGPGLFTYLHGLTDAELWAIDADERTARRALRTIQQREGTA